MSPLTLQQADLLASQLAGALTTVCERIEVAGSIRRRKRDPKDIELVLIPKWEAAPVTGQAALFGSDNTKPVNSAQKHIEAMVAEGGIQIIKPGTQDIIPWHLSPDGKYWRLHLPEQRVKVDVFVCTPATWGLNLMIRTGSGVGPSGKAQDGFAPAMLVRWKAVSGGGQSYEAQLRGANGGTRPTPEEQDVFEACKVRWVPPEKRISSRDVEMNYL